MLAALVPVCRDRARRLRDAAGRRRRGRQGDVDRGADARHRRRLLAGVAARGAALRGRRLGDRDPRRGLQRGHARRLAARLQARAQPPDPVAHRLPAPDVRDAGGDHRDRRARGDAAAADRRPRVPARASRRSARRSRSRSCACRSAGCAGASPTATGRTGCRSTCASAGGDLPLPAALGALLSGAAFVAVLAFHGGAPLGRPRLDGVRHRRLRLLPPLRGQAAAQADHGPRAGADAEARRRPSTARSSCRSSARRSTTTSSRPRAAWPPRRTRTSARAAP